MTARSLAIDTSGSFCSVALKDHRGVVHKRCSGGEGDHFEQLPGLVRDVCTQAGIALHDLAQLRVGVGPGSFTGLRIGMSYAKGLASALRISCLGSCSFYAAAYAYALQNGVSGRVTVVADARRDEVFYGLYGVQDQVVSVIAAPSIITNQQLVDAAAEGGVHITPQRELAVGGVVAMPETDIGWGLVCESDVLRAFSVEEIATLEPRYLRDVAAKTIEQRRVERRGLTPLLTPVRQRP